MEELRLISRTQNGRLELLKDADELLRKIVGAFGSLADESSKQTTDATAILANVFSEDASGSFLAKCESYGIIGTLVHRLSKRLDMPAVLVCLGNAWKQSASHRQAIVSNGFCNALCDVLGDERWASQGLGALRAIAVDESTELASTSQDVLQRLFSCVLSLSEKGQPTRPAACRALVSSSLFLSLDVNRALDVALNTSDDDVRWDEMVDFLSDTVACSEPAMKACREAFPTAFFGKVSLWLKKGLPTVEPDLETFISLSEFLANVSKEAPDSLVSAAFEQNLDVFSLDIVRVVTDQIPAKVESRVVDQAKVLPYARIRLNLLSFLLNLSLGEARSRRLISSGAPGLCLGLAKEYVDYDMEATRVACLLLKNFALADSHAVVMSGDVASVTSRLVISPDQHTSFLSAGVFRMCCARAGRESKAAWERLTGNPRALLEILSLDISKVHPHARVELARGLATLLKGFSEWSPESEEHVLLTAQAVKFVAFLLQAPQRELILEAVEAIGGMRPSFIEALPALEIEIIPGSELIARLKELRTSKQESLDVKDVRVFQECDALLERMKAK